MEPEEAPQAPVPAAAGLTASAQPEPAPSNKKGKSKATSSTQAKIGFATLVPWDEIDRITGSHFEMPGSFWKESSAAEKEKSYDMIVLGVVKEWVPSPGMPPRRGIKVGILSRMFLQKVGTSR